LEPENPDLLEYEREVKLKVSKGQPSLPSTIGFEKIVNPFLRCDDLAIVSAAKKRSQQVSTNEVEIFTTIREWKNTF
jgi:hydroxyacylglutathione hydrolase